MFKHIYQLIHSFIFLFLPAIAFLLSSCTTDRILYVDETGATVREARCNGSYLTIGDCLARASSVCHGKFEILLNKEQNIGTTQSLRLQNRETDMFNNGLVLNENMQISRYIIFRCRE